MYERIGDPLADGAVHEKARLELVIAPALSSDGLFGTSAAKIVVVLPKVPSPCTLTAAILNLSESPLLTPV